ncbi:uncharacterized protein TNIN_205721 [Trichonephila inaurata madagascariensis]|uniref:Uncharacterized protein n=1 Tax=Trichonephila inaurata madagascariensis TaxID=2747483 RepID=A0A8X7BZB2_9ARAC|nr:uncharacterized protein TNIN_205721 [Trichonephila inaurata madagascariensis]
MDRDRHFPLLQAIALQTTRGPTLREVSIWNIWSNRSIVDFFSECHPQMFLCDDIEAHVKKNATLFVLSAPGVIFDTLESEILVKNLSLGMRCIPVVMELRKVHVAANKTTPHPPIHYTEDLKATVLGLRFRVEQNMFKSDELRLKCTATLSRVVSLAVM